MYYQLAISTVSRIYLDDEEKELFFLYYSFKLPPTSACLYIVLLVDRYICTSCALALAIAHMQERKSQRNSTEAAAAKVKGIQYLRGVFLTEPVTQVT